MAYVVLLEDKYPLGWDGTRKGLIDEHGNPIRQGVVTELRAAITATYNTAACIQPGVLMPDGQAMPVGSAHPRLLVESAARLATAGHKVKFDSIWFDIDYRHKNKQRPPTDWHPGLIAKFPNVPENNGWYTSNNGVRLFWLLEPALDHEQFLALHKALLRHLSSVLNDQDTLVDPNCSSWAHVYFLPNIPKRPGARIDIDSLGPLTWSPSTSAAQANEDYYLSALASQGFVLPDEVPQGARNDTMYRYACSLMRKGLAERIVLEYVVQASEERCHPPMPLGEVEYLVRKAYKRFGEYKERVTLWDKTSEGLPSADVEGPLSVDIDHLESKSSIYLARKMLAAIEANSTEPLVYDRDRLHFYDPKSGHWQVLEKNELYREIYKLDGTPVVLSEKNGMPVIGRLGMDHTQAKNNILPAMEVERHQPRFFDEADYGVSFANGFVRPMPTGLELVDHSPVHRTRFSFPFAYKEDANPELFIRFLNDLFLHDEDREDKVRLVREFLGIALLGYAPKLAKVLFLTGEGSNGKSTLLDIFQGVLQSTGQAEALLCGIPLRRFSELFSIANLKDAYINLIDDMSGQVVTESAEFKSAVTGGLLTGALKFGNEFQFRPRAAMVFSVNRLPAVTDASEGFWRRVLTCSFNRKFVIGVDAKLDMAQQILSAEISDLTSWLVAGAADAVARNCFVAPASSKRQTSEWRTNSDSVAQFLSEDIACRFMNPDSELRVPISELYPKYTLVTQQNGGKPVGKNQFSQRLKQIGFDTVRDSSSRYIVFPPLQTFETMVNAR